MQNLKKLTALLAVAAAAPAVVVPTLVSSAQAQDRAEFRDVPTTHWAYPALQKLAAAGVLEGYPPDGRFIGQRPMTRYEFAVAIARILDRIPAPYNDASVVARLDALEKKPTPVTTTVGPTRAEINDLLAALRREFADELARMNVRIDTQDNRIAALENRVTAPPRLSIGLSALHRTGVANYINNGPGAFGGGNQFAPGLGAGRGNAGVFNSDGLGVNPAPAFAVTPRNGDAGADDANKKFSYTEFEVRLTDRVSDRLSLNAAIRSLGGTQEDSWTGETGSNIYVREAFAVADVSDRRFGPIRGSQLTLGRQRMKIGTGLLYDNDLQPTDALRADVAIGPVGITGFLGSQNNVSTIGPGGNPYTTTGNVAFLNSGVTPAVDRFIGVATPTTYTDDNESLIRADVSLFKISGQPVKLGISRLQDGYGSQQGDSIDLSLPLFNRTIGLEVVRQRQYANGVRASQDFINGGGDRPLAGLASLNLLRSSILDLNVAYGKADTGFEYFTASSTNPYARSYGEAIFDRPVALGAPLIGPSAGNTTAFYAVKEALDVSGTLRLPLPILRRVPLDFRYYRAGGGEVAGDTIDLGKVYSVGTKFAVTPGVDLEVKGGIYDPDAINAAKVRYFRIGASVGF